MSVFTFDYLPLPRKDSKTGKIVDQIFIPVIPVRIIYNHQLYRNPINCLVDSGAERNLFPAFFAEKLGIKVKKGDPKTIFGIGGVKIEGFTHNVTLYINTLSFKSQIDFSYEQEVPLLGRIGFFDKFEKVTFQEKKGVVELER